MGLVVNLSIMEVASVERLVSDDEIDLPSLGSAVVGEFSLEYNWHALHWLLTGSVDPIPRPISFLYGGAGFEVSVADRFYCLHSSTDVAILADLLERIKVGDLEARFDGKLMDSLGIYPSRFDSWTANEEEKNDQILQDFRSLKAFIQDEVAAGGYGMMVELA